VEQHHRHLALVVHQEVVVVQAGRSLYLALGEAEEVVEEEACWYEML